MGLEFQVPEEPLQTYATYVDANEPLQTDASYVDIDVNLLHDGDENNDEGMFNDAHNHELSITPTKVMKHHSHGKSHRSLACKSLMVELGQSGLYPLQIKKVVNAMKAPFVTPPNQTAERSGGG
ncbi:unnamed protein product [Lactuca saligna]|uniref:Uncharacterized protein n=1 Tax=Lactuca saligna TaxID=75948 RepID=A0AA35VW59_LACSI|nr:unnamed protein product [Lactuca saligna]